MPTLLLAVFFVLSCSQQQNLAGVDPVAVPADSEIVEHFSIACRGPELFQGPGVAAKALSTHQWARDRYAEGLVVEWNYRSDIAYPVMRQALDLVADTLYAMILPSKGIEALTINISIEDLGADNRYTLGRASGNFYNVGNKKGLPKSGEVEIEINRNIFEDNTEDDHPRHLSALDDWYMLFLHESFHVLGFGLSPTWESLQTRRRHDYFICGRELVSWSPGHWSTGGDYNNRTLMSWLISSWNVVIVPETFCALELLGWTLRAQGQTASTSATSTTSTAAVAEPPAKPTNLRVGSITDSSAKVAWDASAGATDYDLTYRPAEADSWTALSHRTALHHAIGDLEPNTEYIWAVRSENDEGPSDWAFGPRFTTLAR